MQVFGDRTVLGLILSSIRCRQRECCLPRLNCTGGSSSRGNWEGAILVFVATAVIVDIFSQSFRSQNQILSALLLLPVTVAFTDSIAPAGAQAPVILAFGGAALLIILAAVV